MAKKKKDSFKRREGVVYSTNPDFNYFENIPGLQATLPKDEQKLTVRLEKKGRAGKAVTLVEGFVGGTEDLKDLAKQLKNQCGVGGSQKDGVIIIQGDFRKRILELLNQSGYSARGSN